MISLEEAYTQMNLLYGVEMDDDDFIDIALIGWRRIGNKITRLYRYKTDVDCDEKSITLPCNADEVELIVRPGEDWKYTTGVNMLGDYNSLFTENYIESMKLFKDRLYESGRFVKYQQVGDKVYFDSYCGPVTIVYKGIYVDENGLPYITEKEKDALAAFCAYISMFKKGMATLNTSIINEAALIENKWKQLCDGARVSERVSQNDMDKILDARTNWNRKIFNKSYKPVK